jgi:hypothetical protein
MLAEQGSYYGKAYAGKENFRIKDKRRKRENALSKNIFDLFLFVVSEVSTGRRCLSLALFFYSDPYLRTSFTCAKR